MHIHTYTIVYAICTFSYCEMAFACRCAHRPGRSWMLPWGIRAARPARRGAASSRSKSDRWRGRASWSAVTIPFSRGCQEQGAGLHPVMTAMKRSSAQLATCLLSGFVLRSQAGMGCKPAYVRSCPECSPASRTPLKGVGKTPALPALPASILEDLVYLVYNLFLYNSASDIASASTLKRVL